MVYSFDVNKLDMTCKNPQKIIISDSSNYHMAHFSFDSSWLDYSKTIVFTNTKTEVSSECILDNKNYCYIPWDVLKYPTKKSVKNAEIIVGVKGNKIDEDGNLVEMWTKMKPHLYLIQSDKSTFVETLKPTPDVYTQILLKLDSKGDSLDYDNTSNKLSLKSGDKTISTVTINANVDMDIGLDYSEESSKLSLKSGEEVLSTVTIPVAESSNIDFSRYFNQLQNN